MICMTSLEWTNKTRLILMLNLLLPTVEFPEGFTLTKAPQKMKLKSSKFLEPFTKFSVIRMLVPYLKMVKKLMETVLFNLIFRSGIDSIVQFAWF